MGTLDGKVALVTGASRGIGRGIALALARSGANVAVNYRVQAEAAEETCEEIRQLGREFVKVQADVSVAAEVTRLIDEAMAKLGPISILVNNAGITRPERLESISERSWDELIDTNLKSAFLVTQAVLPMMRKTGWGRIINISSVAAQLGGVVGPHYAASKSGLIGMTHAYANALAREGITVNAIAPALIETAMTDVNSRAKPDLIPVGRFGNVREVADVAVVLATNAYITGQTINVNGGWYMSS